MLTNETISGTTNLEPRFHKSYTGGRFSRQQLTSGLQAITKKENTGPAYISPIRHAT